MISKSIKKKLNIFKRRILKNNVIRNILAKLATLYIILTGYTSRFEYKGSGYNNLRERVENGKPVIFAVWHGRLLLMHKLIPDIKVPTCVLISHHRDGDIIASAMIELGFIPIRGSSNRGGRAAFMTLLRNMRNGNSVLVTPDGPRGPKMIVNSNGVVNLAQLSQYEIYPIAFSARWSISMNTWDSFLLTMPFNRGVFFVGKPINVPLDASKQEHNIYNKLLENALNDVTIRADRYMGHHKIVREIK